MLHCVTTATRINNPPSCEVRSVIKFLNAKEMCDAYGSTAIKGEKKYIKIDFSYRRSLRILLSIWLNSQLIYVFKYAIYL